MSKKNNSNNSKWTKTNKSLVSCCIKVGSFSLLESSIPSTVRRGRGRWEGQETREAKNKKIKKFRGWWTITNKQTTLEVKFLSSCPSPIIPYFVLFYCFRRLGPFCLFSLLLLIHLNSPPNSLNPFFSLFIHSFIFICHMTTVINKQINRNKKGEFFFKWMSKERKVGWRGKGEEGGEHRERERQKKMFFILCVMNKLCLKNKVLN